jgi:hypothetical protein
MFDGDVAAGPVPLLFAANPDVAAASIAAEPAKAHFDLSKVLSDIYFIKHSKLNTKVIFKHAFIRKSRLKQFDFCTGVAQVPPARDLDTRHGQAVCERSQVILKQKHNSYHKLV